MPRRSASSSSATLPPGASRTSALPESAERPEYRVEALAKGLRILSLFNEQRPSWRVSDLAAAAGLPMPTVYRVVMTLASEGYLDHLPNGDYRPGVRTLTLGTAALRSLDLVAIATPKLTELGERTGETVNLAVLSGDRVLYLIRLRNSDLVTANIQVGSTLPAVHTSIGKLLLAHLDEADLQSRITDASFAANSGPNAKVSLAELRDELRTIREQGWAMQDEELAYGLRSVAAPIIAPVGYDTGLDDRCREIAILVVAAHWRSDFEWYAHEAVGRAAGLGDGELAALRDGRHAELAGRESVVARTAAALVVRGDLDDDE